jgi:rhodanese-related sulfurtransferase
MSPTRPESTVPVLDRDALRAKLAGGAPFKLVMAASDFGFRAKHIPGSFHIDPRGKGAEALDPDDDVVVYCSNVDCIASHAVIKKLLERGYRKVSHYPGGLIDWEAAGLPLEGDWAAGPSGVR